MKTLNPWQTLLSFVIHRRFDILPIVLAISALFASGLVEADVPLRALPGGAVPNPGTQQQELTNITAPAEFNVFEFVVTCAGCHGGSIDLHAGHFGNWAGGSMASAARDPVFRANQIGVNNVVKSITNLDGSGNVCMRCHSPNGWLSGRFDPSLGGKADGSNLINSILLSTDAEGISCETCHRAVGNVTFKRSDLNPNDSVWNLLGGITDWTHTGRTMTDQANDPSIANGLPYGDTSLQFQDGISYVGKYSGTGDIYFSDLPIGGSYTGQIYAVYPPNWTGPKNPVPLGQPATNSAGQELAYNQDGTLPPLFEAPVNIPSKNGVIDYMLQGLSLEHPTTGSFGRKGSLLSDNGYDQQLPAGPGGSTSPNEFIRTSEFCGSCHDLTVPILNHGMPEQRTFTEWKLSSYASPTHEIDDPLGKRTGPGQERCQDCHMPTLKHEYSDDNTASLNPDPLLAGSFPYGKDRGPQGGTAFHKLAGANRDLPAMMKVLYPEVDLEVIGWPTGKDPRTFPGMLSDRGPLWDRAARNSEISMRDSMDVQIVTPPTEVPNSVDLNGNATYEMQVKVTNKSGHRIPSGYPDGRRFWLEVLANDGPTTVYRSGFYDAAQAQLKTTSTAPFNRALSNVIDATNPANNAVMVYERVTGTCTDSSNTAIFPDPTGGTPAACSPSPALTNNFMLFDNRIPPKGLDYAAAREAGVKFWNYNPANFVPTEDVSRYDSFALLGGYDVVTYRFTAPTGKTLTASAEAYWQTHTREFMEHLRDQDTTTVRPQGPPDPFAIGYPFTANYLSDNINGKPLTAIADPFRPGVALNDNWGGVAYAAWLETGKGAPFLVDSDDTTVTAAPAIPTGLTVAPTGTIDPVTEAPDVFSARVSWSPAAGADGYAIWVRYGASDATADWDRLAVVDANTTSFVENVFNPGKTYGFKVVAFNGKGETSSSAVNYTTAGDLPAAPTGLAASTTAPGSTGSQITLTWTDNATNDVCFDVWRFDVVAAGVPPVNTFVCVLGNPDTTNAVTGQTSWVDTTVAANTCYNYQVRAQNVNGEMSTWSAQAQGCSVAPAGTLNLTAAASGGFRVDLNWTVNPTGITSFRVTRGGQLLQTVLPTASTTYSYADQAVLPDTTYTYVVEAMAGAAVQATGSATVTTPAVPAAPTGVLATVNGPRQVTVTWADGNPNDLQDGYVLERAPVVNGVVGGFVPMTAQGAFFTQTSYVDTTVLPASIYAYRVKAIRLQIGDSAWAFSPQATTPLEPLTSVAIAFDALPAGPFTTNASGTETNITVTWIDTLNEGGYEVQRCIGNTTNAQCGANGAQWATLPNGNRGADVINLVDGSVNPATSNVRYRVRATKPGFTATAWRNSVPATIAVPALPGKPGFTQVAAASNNPAQGLPRVTVTWNNVANDNGYVLERSADAGASWGFVTNRTAAQVSFVDTAATGLVAGSYVYRVTAVGNSGWNTSAQSSTVTLIAPPQATINSVSPTGTAIQQRTRLAVNFTIPAGASGWELQRLNAGVWANVNTGTNAGIITYTNTLLTAGTTYTYRVRTYASGGIILSAEVSGTTAP